MIGQCLLQKSRAPLVNKVQELYNEPGSYGDSSAASSRRQSMHLVFVTDCSSHQRWMAMLLFHSANRVGQSDPISWLRWDCDAGRLSGREEEARLLRRVYPEASLVDISGHLPVLRLDISWIKPLALQTFLSQSPGISNDTVIAMLDADFIFLSRLRVDDLDEHSIVSIHEPAVNATVQGLHGVVQHYECCRHAGAPYIFSAKAWRELLPEYAGLSEEATGAWGEEQVAFATAALRAGVTFSVFDHFMVSDLARAQPVPKVPQPHGGRMTPKVKEGEGWAWVEKRLEAAGGHDCGPPGPADAGPAGGRLPTFLHVVRPVNPEGGNDSWQFSKYQVPPGWKRPEGEGVLDCDMPLLAEPPAELVRLASGRQTRLAWWMLCSTIHSINGMLMDVKGLKCPSTHNQARVLKIQKNFHNTLLSYNGVDATPEGVDAAFITKCAVGLNCSRGSGRY